MIAPNDITASHLIWNKQNREHIQKHGLKARQVEQIFQDRNRVLTEGKQARPILTGRCGHRLLSLILAPEGKNYYLVTARDASKEEREFYRSNLENDNEKL